MRPQSEVRLAVSAALVDGPGTTRQLAQRTGWSVGLVRKALDNMAQAGEAYVSHVVQQRGARRRVPVYARKAVVAQPVRLPGAMLDLARAWHGGGVAHAQ